MTLNEAAERLKKRGLLAKVLGEGICGGVSAQKGGYTEAYAIVPGDGDETFLAVYINDRSENVQCFGLDTAVDAIVALYHNKGLVPPTPTSDSWETDAQGLVDMGAKAVDVNTVNGILEELRQYRLAVERIEARLEGRIDMNRHTWIAHDEEDAKLSSKIRMLAYQNALSDVRLVMADVKKGGL